MKMLLIVGLIAALPAFALAGGANIKTNRDDKTSTKCAPGFYFETPSGLCIAANWI